MKNSKRATNAFISVLFGFSRLLLRFVRMKIKPSGKKSSHTSACIMETNPSQARLTVYLADSFSLVLKPKANFQIPHYSRRSFGLVFVARAWMSMRDVSLGNKDNLSCNLACATPTDFWLPYHFVTFPEEGLLVPLVDQFRRNLGDSLSAFFARYEDDERLNGNGMKRCLPGAAPDRELREEDRDDPEDATLRSSVLELRSIGLTDATEPERCVFWSVVGIP